MKPKNTLMDDNALMKAGYDLLCDHFGLVEAAHFISLVNANRFDYTESNIEKFGNKYYYAFGTTFFAGFNFTFN